MPIRLRPTHTSCCTYAIYPVVSHSVPCHIRGIGRQERQMAMFSFTSEKRETFGGWSRCVKVGDQEYSVSVRRGKMVKIPYKPRGQNKGYHWYGAVYKIGSNQGRVWEDRVPGSIGCRGLLFEAGVFDEATQTAGV